MRLEGKRILVTAAGQGIGRAVALAAAREGADVVATDVAEDKLADLDGKVGGTRRLDMTASAAVSAFAAEIGRVDGLCNIAGFVQSGCAVEAGGLVHRALHRRIRGQLCHGAAHEGRRYRMPHSRLVWVEASVLGDRRHEAASRRAK